MLTGKPVARSMDAATAFHGRSPIIGGLARMFHEGLRNRPSAPECLALQNCSKLDFPQTPVHQAIIRFEGVSSISGLTLQLPACAGDSRADLLGSGTAEMIARVERAVQGENLESVSADERRKLLQID